MLQLSMDYRQSFSEHSLRGSRQTLSYEAPIQFPFLVKIVAESRCALGLMPRCHFKARFILWTKRRVEL